MKKNKEWEHNRFLKQRERWKIKKSRRMLADLCRIFGHEWDPDYNPFYIRRQCVRCGLEPHYVYHSIEASTVHYVQTNTAGTNTTITLTQP